ncbi:MAG: aspartate kinase [Candidatus Margulisiibacteriota bacterium]
MMLVQKYGGTSVGSIERIKSVAARILENQKIAKDIVVVVSAMGDTTDDLIKLIKQITTSPSPREYDAIISTGENISAALLAIAIQTLGGKAISLTGSQAGIYTENIYSRAKIKELDTSRIKSELKEGKVVVITGFQGINDYNDVTTIGRGGSDTSAVVLAAALKASVCEIYTDVDGVYTTDPRIVTNAKKLKEISYDEMLELASLGAKVLHPRSVEIAKENKIKLYVKSSFSQDEGTLVKEANNMEIIRPVTGVTINEEEAIISIFGVKDEPGVAGKLFSRLAEVNINVDMIIQSSQENNINRIAFTVNRDVLDQAQEITKEIAASLNADGVTIDNKIAKISIVGVGMISKPGVAAKMFEVLGKGKINIKLISTSEIKISCAIEENQAKEALQLLHAAFELDKI